MDLKIIVLFLVWLIMIFVAFYFLKRTEKGKKYFYIIFGTLLTINLSHFIVIKFFVPTSIHNMSLAVGYVMYTFLELLLLIIFSIVWFVVVKRKDETNDR